MVRSMDTTNAQINPYLNWAPAIEHIVMVPGPINAAATTDAGPICFNR